ncbi:MAG: SixA phosphatase family protein [Acidimicrobiales bacterium]
MIGPMQLYMVRHAHAGQRSHNGRDIYRPLSTDGHERAAELVEIFDGRPIDRLLSSPATRCSQTLAPLGSARGLEVEECQDLWEGSTIADAIAAMEIGGAQSIVACSHGDIIPAMIDNLGAQGVPIAGRGCELGSIWILEFDEGRWLSARYVSTRDKALA